VAVVDVAGAEEGGGEGVEAEEDEEDVEGLVVDSGVRVGGAGAGFVVVWHFLGGGGGGEMWGGVVWCFCWGLEGGLRRG
jgi:hypothetical protein